MIDLEWALVETAEGRAKYTAPGRGNLDLVAASLLPLLRTALAGGVDRALRPVAVNIRYLADVAAVTETLLCTIHYEQGPGGVVLVDVEVVGAVSARRLVRAEGILVPG